MNLARRRPKEVGYHTVLAYRTASKVALNHVAMAAGGCNRFPGRLVAVWWGPWAADPYYPTGRDL